MRADIIPGAKFPDYELTDHTRTRRHLSELQGNDPMILLLSRGHYCPEELRSDLRAITRKIRPDWDLSAPGLRENWERGDKSQHYPY